MKWGIDQYSRYIEIRGERFAVETYPYWGYTPQYLFRNAAALIGIGIWRASKFTGLGWNGTNLSDTKEDAG